VEAFQTGADLHTQTAALIWRITPEKVTKEQRAIAKNSNFAFAFGGGPGRVQEMAGVSEFQAVKIYTSWHEAYPGVKRYGRRATVLCQDKGYASTAYGRRRRLPDIYSNNSFNRSYAERQAINHPIQGLAADIAKIALVQIHAALDGHDARLVLQVHDKFVIEVAESEVDEVVALVRKAMEDVERNGSRY
jgi:DNA polymerase-1